MFCPHCGTANSTEHQFCRSCGLSLEKIQESLAEQRPQVESDKHLQDRQRQIDRLLTIILSSAFTVFVLAILYALIYKIIILKGQVLEGSIFLGLFLTAITALLMVIYRESLRESKNKRGRSQATLADREKTGKLPEARFEPLASVTERTTELLFSEDKREQKP